MLKRISLVVVGGAWCCGNAGTMAAYLQMFLFLFKSKYRRKWHLGRTMLYLFIVCWFVCVECNGKCSDVQCVNGQCVNGSCVCNDGWQGSSCQFCGGKVKLTAPNGSIHDGAGNYSIDVKCSWLIDAGAPNITIRLHIEEFATECGWDHLYIYDGDSVHSPIIGVFSGLMYMGNYGVRRIPEIVARSGSALIHFYSDVAYNMTGFNITYRFNSCPSLYSNTNCSGHGECVNGVCECELNYVGEACDIPACPNKCNHPNGVCGLSTMTSPKGCKCNDEYRGDDCSQHIKMGYWEVLQPKGFKPEGSASHGAVVWKDSLYIVGGESYKRAKMLYMYDFNGEVWETLQVEAKNAPSPRYGHSTVIFGDKIFMYGGVEESGTVSSELWAFDVSAKTWENITVRPDPCNATGNFTGLCGPLRSAGHSATVIKKSQDPDDRMVVIFGHSPLYGYLNTVQEFVFGSRQWRIVQTKGFPVRGGYGHTSAWDPLTNLIYVYGGYVSESFLSHVLSSRLYSYDPDSHIWKLLTPAPSSRFLHTASFLSGGLMLVFGGNTHNDTIHSHGAKCYSSELLAYDVVCDSWSVLPMPSEALNRADLARYGHSAVLFGGSLYIYGGFDGQMLSDIVRYTPGKCTVQLNREDCVGLRAGVKCLWNLNKQRCENVTLESSLRPFNSDVDDEFDSEYSRCPEEGRAARTAAAVRHSDLCSSYSDCYSCVQTSYSCKWCQGEDVCVYGKNSCKGASTYQGNSVIHPHAVIRPISALDQCVHSDTQKELLLCQQQHSCHMCWAYPNCGWHYESQCNVTYLHPFSTQAEQQINLLPHPQSPHQHQPSIAAQSQSPRECLGNCARHTSCMNCTSEECIWCQNEGRCIDKNAYTASFPYGQCREWTTTNLRCRANDSDKSACSFFSSCKECRDDPSCGWCDDGSGTGLGTCMPGGNSGPNFGNCAKERWYFTNCSICQCNGHSTCSNNSNVCNQPCANLTQGPNCDRCTAGYYGNPANGGSCVPCECNDQGTQCNPETGKCFCTTKGIVGDHCERCDISNHYHGDPTNHGSCFYDLAIDYQFTFNLSKKEDRHFTQINFKNSPPKPDVDADFIITCSSLAKMNITIKTARDEHTVVSEHNCTTFRRRFNKAEHVFGGEDNSTQTTFYVYVYDFHTPLWIQISFSQYPKLNLQQFFITFSTCFLLLLLVAAILWKIKQKYDMYRRRQRLFVEMEQMASRPFSQVLVEIEKREKVADNGTVEADVNHTSVGKRKKVLRQDSPSPIALEPCCGNRAAVLSLLIRLPTGGEPYTPPGQSAGLAIASALVTLGNPRKVSLDPATKCDQKSSKSRKSLSSQHPDSCI